jgi:L-alanine-DL-glutamate epimerase-like enolase superfamily enzyme
LDLIVHTLEVQYLPVVFSNPLSFGKQKIESLEKLRIKMVLKNPVTGESGTGWGEVPVNYPWFWPQCTIENPMFVIRDIVSELVTQWLSLGKVLHPLLSGFELQTQSLNPLYTGLTEKWGDLPFLAVQVMNSAFDIALYDGFAKLCSLPVYKLFDSSLIPVSLDFFFKSNRTVSSLMKGIELSHLLKENPPSRLGVWHMVGIVDPVPADESCNDLARWIVDGGIKRLKIKLSSMEDQDMNRLKEIYKVSRSLGVEKYSFDYNGSKDELRWMIPFLENLKADIPGLYEKLVYIEQPIRAGMTGNRNEVRSITAMKDLLVDEGAGNWEVLYEYYQAGWSGVALKICKSQTSSILMYALSRVLNKRVTVMDLTNPSLAHIAHVQLAAHLSDDPEIESNAIQYCPLASLSESKVHPKLFSRSQGDIDLSSLTGFGYGYRMDEIQIQETGINLEKAACISG